jgi:hypothetical protein
MNATKLTNNSISVEKTTEPIVTTYDYDFLVSQKSAIIKQANDFLSARQSELDDVQALLDQCDQLGVVAREMPQPLQENLSTNLEKHV